MPTADVFTLTMRVPDADIDPQGHVNNVAFVRYVQDAAVAHWRAVAPADVRAAVAWVVRRHEIWRTTFEVRDGEPVQVINPAPSVFPLQVVDLSELPDSKRASEAIRLASENARRRFDLSKGPLLRALLVRLDDEDYRLYMTFHQIIFDGVSEASLAARLFESFGIAKERITLEDQSRDTLENARFTKALVQPKSGERWLLVTSAHHMPRSVGLFRSEGFAVEAFPVDYRTRGAIDMLRPFSTLGDGLRRTDTAMREWVGLFIYWASGRTAARASS